MDKGCGLTELLLATGSFLIKWRCDAALEYVHGEGMDAIFPLYQ
jgi:hypothetical protein